MDADQVLKAVLVMNTAGAVLIWFIHFMTGNKHMLGWNVGLWLSLICPAILLWAQP